MFALWTWAGTGPGSAPRGIGERETVALAVPSGRWIEIAEVECALVEPERLPTLPLPDLAVSGRAWLAALTDTPGPLPAAAHAVPNAAGTAVVSPERALRTLRETVALAGELRSGLKAELRPYQARGITWLRETTTAHGGAVLADEMGLGKTVQAIGFLLGRAAEGPQLVVCPTSLVGNWVHEIERFAPGLRAVAWRGGQPPHATAGTVVVTGYPTLRGHGPALTESQWSAVVFDEAQVLKNPRTQVAKAARAIDAAVRVALTGTPVENHLDELWALLNLVVPGEFTHRSQFRRRFVRPVHEGSAEAVLRLRDAIEPVVLARRKAQVAASLPPKIHSDLVCDLTAEQETLYDRLLDRAEAEGFGSGAQRHTRVLAVLTELKQVCNHPGLITGELDELSGRSGKFDVCADILANNVEVGAPTLVFTQYRRTGELLVRLCAERFGVTAPFLPRRTEPARARRDRAAVPIRRRPTGSRAEPEGGRDGADADPSGGCGAFRPLVESGGGGAGIRSRAPHRADPHRHRHHADLGHHHRGAHRGHARPQIRAHRSHRCRRGGDPGPPRRRPTHGTAAPEARQLICPTTNSVSRPGVWTGCAWPNRSR